MGHPLGIRVKGHKKFVHINLALLEIFLFGDVAYTTTLSLASVGHKKTQG